MNKFKKWMIGRYGIDQLTITLLIVTLILSLIGSILHSFIFTILTFGIIVLCYYRIFSKNLYARQQENFKFMRYYQPLQSQLRKKTKELQGLKTYKYFKCPNCKQKLRVPRGKGNICITCPKCKNTLHKKS
ncbi:MAG: hypothetical protein ACRCTE_03120 [Cellulosilyticaceae bacterium]